MDLEVYFSELKKKYGVTDALSNLINKQKEEYLKSFKDISEEGQQRQLRSIETRIRVEHEIYLIHEDPEFKPLFELAREHMKAVKDEIPKKTDGLKPVLEDLAKTFRDFKKQLDGMDWDFLKKKKK